MAKAVMESGVARININVEEYGEFLKKGDEGRKDNACDNPGSVDGLLAGLTLDYDDAVRPILQIIKTEKGIHRAAGLYIMVTEEGVFFFADATLNVNPDAETLAEIAFLTARFVKEMGIEPKVAFLSYLNFGSVENQNTRKIRKAVEIFREKVPSIIADGEMQAETALVPEIMNEFYLP